MTTQKNKGTLKFGMRTYIEYLCRSGDFKTSYVTELKKIIKKTIKKPSKFNTPFERKEFGIFNTFVSGSIEGLNNGRYLTWEELKSLEKELKANGFKVKL